MEELKEKVNVTDEVIKDSVKQGAADFIDDAIHVTDDLVSRLVHEQSGRTRAVSRNGYVGNVGVVNETDNSVFLIPIPCDVI